MEIVIRPMDEKDRPRVMDMMRRFYTSPAVFTDGSDEIFRRDIDACLRADAPLDGYIIESAKAAAGYVMLAKSFSTEFGKACVWIEDIYLDDAYRGAGIGARVMEFITNRYPDHIFRLEVERENERAVRLYEKFGFSFLPYLEMKK